MNADKNLLQALDRGVAQLIAGDSASETVRTLLGAMRDTTPRGAVFLVRNGELRGWDSFGYPAEAAERQNALRLDATAGWLAGLGQAVEPRLQPLAAEQIRVDFGQPPAAETWGGSVGVAGRPVAVILAQRDAGEGPWGPEALSVLLAVVCLRLELDMALRKLSTAPADGAGSTPNRPEATPATPTPQAERLRDAGRFARLIATDIRLYNEEAVVLGRRHGDLAERLQEALRQGQETFLGRHTELGDAGLALLHEAFVQVLADGNAELLPPPDGLERT